MKSERLDRLALDGVAFDLESHLIQPGLVAPPIVCGSAAESQDGKMRGSILSKAQVKEVFETILEGNHTICGANIAYDVICMLHAYATEQKDIAPQVFAMYDPAQGAVKGDVDGRVYDVQIAEALHAIAKGRLFVDPHTGMRMKGRYSLKEVVSQVLGRDNAKANDRFRLSYALLENTPIDEWPSEARTYPVDDAINTLEVALAQAGHIDNVGPHEWIDKLGSFGAVAPHCANCGALPGANPQCRSRYRRLNSHEISRQTYFALCVNLGAAWGYHINQESVNALETKWHDEHDHLKQPFMEAGILRDDGTENQGQLKRLVARAYGSNEPCQVCANTVGKKGEFLPGKVPSQSNGGKTLVNCDECNGSGLKIVPDVPRTEAGQIAISRDALNQSGEELLVSYADFGEGKKIKTVYIPYLRNTDKETGLTYPNVPRVLRPNSIVETGRASYDGATMLLPRHGGVRECHEARPGYVFSSTDYRAGELVTHAQSCLWIVGASRLAEALNKGLDAHLALAGTILNKSYEVCQTRRKAGDKLVINTRQVAKPPNFGFPGRMGAFTLVLQQRAQQDVHTPHLLGPQWIYDDNGNKVRGYKGLRFCIFMNRAERCGEVTIDEWKGRKYDARACKKCVEVAEELRVSWLKQWPENNPYFDHVKKVDESGEPVMQHMSKRLRGFLKDGESGNAIANGYFQALLADAAKNAYCAATRECYDKTMRVRSYTSYTSRFEGLDSPLYGSRLPQFQHDEIIGEHPEGTASDAADRIGEIMCEALRIACPDMHKAVEAEPCLMRKMYKGAQTIRNKEGRLLVWEPKVKVV